MLSVGAVYRIFAVISYHRVVVLPLGLFLFFNNCYLVGLMGFHRIWLDRDQQQYSDQALVIQALENKGAYASIVRRYEAPLLR